MPSFARLCCCLKQRVLGKVAVVEHDPEPDSGILLKAVNAEFEFIMEFELHRYTWRYKRWYVPDHSIGVVIVKVELQGSPPADLVNACKCPIMLPLTSFPKNGLSRKKRAYVRMLVLDILHARVKRSNKA